MTAGKRDPRQAEAVRWFDPLYREAAGDSSKVPWDDGAPHAALVLWASHPAAFRPLVPGTSGQVRAAVVVGCGLGHDAEFVAAHVPSVTAFDVSPTAIHWAKRIHAGSRVRYEVADLFAPRREWLSAFDLAVEIHTLQALPSAVRTDAARGIASLLAPGGRVFVCCRLRDDGPGAPPFDERTAGPPWPLGRNEVGRLFAGLEVVEPLADATDPAEPAIPRGYGVWRRRP